MIDVHVAALLLFIAQAAACRDRGALSFEPDGSAPAHRPKRHVQFAESSVDVGAGNLWGIAAADLNGDHKLDLAVTVLDIPERNMAVLLGRGDGSFGAPSLFDVRYRARSVQVVDFNEDGAPDLVVGSIGGSFNVLLGLGSGRFSPVRAFDVGGVEWALSADFNHDGHLDLVGSRGDADAVVIVLGRGDGSAGSPAYFAAGSSPAYPTTLDCNGDGRLDLAVPSFHGDGVSVLAGHGDGTFATPWSIPVGTSSTGIAGGDVDGDGHTDVIVTHPSSAYLSVLLGKGDCTFRASAIVPSKLNTFFVALADLDDDGNLDLIVPRSRDPKALYSSGEMAILLGNGDGTFRESVSYPSDGSPSIVAVADLNGDGAPDIAVSDYSASVIHIYLNMSH